MNEEIAAFEPSHPDTVIAVDGRSFVWCAFCFERVKPPGPGYVDCLDRYAKPGGWGRSLCGCLRLRWKRRCT